MASAPPALRKLTLAVAVLHDVDLLPDASGLLLARAAGLRIEWQVIEGIVAAADEHPDAGERRRIDAIAAWLKARQALAMGAEPVGLGMPSGHVDHPGRAWIREHIPGGALDLGFGRVSSGDNETATARVLAIPSGVLEHAYGDDAEPELATRWERARHELEAAGEVAALRDRRHVSRALVPVGATDVVTLLGAASLRRELVESEGDGMAALIVPLRTRGWRANSIADPAYGPALAAAMEPEERGFVRPLLVTAEEISEVRAGGDPMRLLRRDAEDG